MDNKEFYESDEAVLHYADSTELQAPELSIIQHIGPSLQDMSMLDIGVGTGRTTKHFAPLVRTYIGTDYSESMINACNSKIDSFPKNASFLVCDAADMSAFGDNSFDFVFFSFNGIDYLSHTGRLAALAEIQRVTKIGGLFCFSTHNLQTLLGMPAIPTISFHPKELFRRIKKFAQHAKRNHGFRSLRSKSHAVINDGSYGSQLVTYYVNPVEQLRQLSDAGFSEVEVFSYNTGNNISDSGRLSSSKDPWLYFLCKNIDID